MKTAPASGLQIAFFTFAVLLLAAPATQWILDLQPWSPSMKAMLEKAVIFSIGFAILFGVPGVRRLSFGYLAQPVPRDARVEVATVTVAKLFFPFALAGAYALWHWIHGGEPVLAHYVSRWATADAQMAKAFLLPHMVQMLFLAGVAAPLIEELVFRGFLYRAWERRWGWIPAMLLTSALFGIYHPDFWAAFLGSIVLVCVYRRTGSLWAPIVVHSLTNISLWYPLLGRHLVPRDAIAPGDLGSWGLQLAALLAACVAIPCYVWMARRRREPEDAFPPTVPHGAIQG